ncbi:hypothetical protein ACFP3U_32945 [Kitasatospora misakiensis]|uniref:Hen1 N-terminal domain-containing protein n=1 Tax=Kitasatospora misakiensis TaxID=67330 RepID=A0ABW0XF84_9ACTN
MLISATGTAGSPATDLARLLHRRPDEVHQVSTAFGEAHVFFPEADADRCTLALLVEVDPEALLRGRRGKGQPPVTRDESVDDRPFAGSSLLAAALRTVFRQPLGQPPAPEGDTALPLEIELPVVRADREPESTPGGDGVTLVRRLFEPLGWRVEAAEVPLDAAPTAPGPDRAVEPAHPGPGGSPYVRLRLAAPAVRPAEALRQLVALLPVLDGAAPHWVPPERPGADRLFAAHPERALIARRLARHDDAVTQAEDEKRGEGAAVRAVLGALGATRVVHLGCGHGALLAELLGDGRFAELLGVDVSPAALAVAARRLGLERTADPAPEWELRAAPGRTRLRLVQGAPIYADARSTGFDAMVFAAPAEALAETAAEGTAEEPADTSTERVTPAAHPAYLEYAVFGAARPPAAVATAPPGADGAAFAAWARRTATGYGYAVTLHPADGAPAPAGPRPPRLALFERDTPATGGGGPR